MNDDDLVTGLDYAQRQGKQNHDEWILATSKNHKILGIIAGQWNVKTRGPKVDARIDFERWLVDCPDPLCSGVEMVCLETQVFFCQSCGNVNNDHFGYAVRFPSATKRQEIYDELEKRPLNRFPKHNRIMSVESARPVFAGLGRSWNPGETIKELKAQREIYPTDHDHITIAIPKRKPTSVYPRNDSERGGKN